MTLLSELTSFGGFLGGIPALARRRVTLAEGEATLGQRLRSRGANLLGTVERAYAAGAERPYGALMRAAGCTPSDVGARIESDGVEAALRELREAGVWISFEEFKGNRPIVRGSLSLQTRPADFDNTSARRYLATSTGGSTGAARRVLMDVDFLEAKKASHVVAQEAHGLADVPLAIWAEIPPGHGLEASLVQSILHGNVRRWFTPTWGSIGDAAGRFRLATQVAVKVARAAGVPIPAPEHLPFDRASVIVRWVEEMLRTHGRCAVRAHVSKALRIALAAREMGVSLAGLTISSGGEPPTDAKVREITSTGARFLANYYFMEAGPIGFACTDGVDATDLHFMADHLALITAPREVGAFGIEVGAFHVTTLLPSAPKLLINVELDDYGELECRRCACPFGALGFDVHLRNVRSFSKLTGEGVTLVGSDMERIVESELPARFGGSALDYQLREEEDDRGFTRLTLLVHPRIALDDEGAVLAHVHGELSRMGGAAAVSRNIWEQAGTLRLRREAPRMSERGKMRLLVAKGTD